MSKEIQIFANDQFGEVRTLNKDGEPWFVGKDVAQALGYGEGKSLANAVANHVDDDDKGVTEMMTPGGKQTMVIINESGLYSLILSSKLPTARAFKRWVTSEVLPAMKKGASQIMPPQSEQRDVKSMSELIKISYDNDQPTVSARELHEFLEVKDPYRNWFPRMCEYGFEEGKDFRTFSCETSGGRPKHDAEITIDMAKELCMLQRNERGKQARQYFLQLERDWNSPEKVMARALQIAEKKINTLSADLSKVTVQNTIMQPKANYFDELVDRNLLTNFRETAKQLGLKQNDFIRFLLDKKYIYRDQRGKIMPYAKKNNGLFEVKECNNDKTKWAGTQTLITPKGRETFRLLCQGL